MNKEGKVGKEGLLFAMYTFIGLRLDKSLAEMKE